jgi:hypothetical protein
MKEKAKKSRNRKVKRYALIGLATVGGGALIGKTLPYWTLLFLK